MMMMNELGAEWRGGVAFVLTDRMLHFEGSSQILASKRYVPLGQVQKHQIMTPAFKYK